MPRVFFAEVWPDAPARDALDALARGCAAQTGGRAAVSSNLHLTLAFVGEVATSRVTALQPIGLAATAAVLPFTLTLDQIGAFRSAGIAWIGTSTLPPELEQVVRTLNDELERRISDRAPGIPAAYVTPAHAVARQAASLELAAPIAWRVESVAPNGSESLRGGVRYRALAEWPPRRPGGRPLASVDLVALQLQAAGARCPRRSRAAPRATHRAGRRSRSSCACTSSPSPDRTASPTRTARARPEETEPALGRLPGAEERRVGVEHPEVVDRPLLELAQELRVVDVGGARPELIPARADAALEIRNHPAHVVRDDLEVREAGRTDPANTMCAIATLVS